ncbi:hypothetical protein LCGC14_0519730 [marine sediment metagenome]|uniref:PilZ domain-containing protein n=1 Tax=marine sediment metagenome TaxID=412755 RepID=A0A0F9UK93_9ZZZZ|nr:PilZ domain-containing protein [Methylophaga sp.]HEC60214.1 PilZ domain-containing protein [Methylophaga sp.]
MENMSEFNDRRNFFRINDIVYIDVTELNHEDATEATSAIKNPPSDDNHSQEKQQLSTIQASLTHLIEQINHTDRQVARALRLLDDKISIVSNSIQRQQNNMDTRKMVESNLSGGGIAFLTAHQYAHKATLDLRIELQPSGTIIHTIANVVACDKHDDSPANTPYYLRLVFTHMSEYDRNFLVKHILSRQAEMLRTTEK